MDREIIIQIVLTKDDLIIALTNKGDILRQMSNGTWQGVVLPVQADYEEKIKKEKESNK